jgi:peptidyl-tRNA hydrolase, PTH2 family
MMQTKQVIILRKDLNMRKGKMVAQGAHASLLAILSCAKQTTFSGALGDGSGTWTLKAPAAMTEWINGQHTKICVSVNSEQELEALYERAKANGIPCAMVTDAGHTEFNGVPTKTAVAIGPAKVDAVDEITGKLPLL